MERTPALRSPEQAKENLKSRVDVSNLLGELETLGSEADFLLAGSTALRALDPGFRNNLSDCKDLDFYVRDIDERKLEIFDNAVEKTFKDPFMILRFRLPLTMNWYIMFGPLVFQKIQLVLLHLRSWPEFWVTCHAHLVCSGYSTAAKSFVTMPQRFGVFQRWVEMGRNPREPFVFSNIHNADTEDSLRRAAEKYKLRGYPCAVENHRGPRCNIDAPEELAGSQSDFEWNHPSIPTTNLRATRLENGQKFLMYWDLLSLTRVSDLVRASNSIRDLVKPPFLRALDLAKFDFKQMLTEFPYAATTVCEPVDDREENVRRCPIDYERHSVWAKFKCGHFFGFASYLKLRSDQCPLCRKLCVLDEIELEPILE